MSWWRRLFTRRRMERDLDKELRFHFEEQVQQNLKAGMDSDEALRRARLDFGSVDGVKEECRDARGTRWVESTLQDVRYALRSLRMSPSFSLVVILSLAIGIGANAAVFSVMDSLLFKKLPVTNPGELVILNNVTEKNLYPTFSYPAFTQVRQRHQAFSDVLAFAEPGTMRLTAAGQSSDSFETVQTSQVSANYFSVLGVSAAIGRTFLDTDAIDGETGPLCVISYGLWDRRFGRDPAITGKSIVLNNRPFTIVGVAPRGFSGVEVGRSYDLWRPLDFTDNPLKKNSRLLWIGIMARLRPGMTDRQAQADTEALFLQLQAESRAAAPNSRYFLEDVRGLALRQGSTGSAPALRTQFTSQLVILWTIAAFVLLIACANISNLLLARGSARRREFAIRLAIGSGRARLIRQLLTESVVVSGFGGVVGLIAAYWGIRFLLSYMPAQSGSSLNAGVDLRVMAFMACISMACAILFGIGPALRNTKPNLTPGLNNRHSDDAGSRFSIQRILIVTQVALSLMLLVGAGLFVLTLRNLRTFDAGFDRNRVLRFSVGPGPGYTPAQRLAFHKEVFGRLERLPGVSSVSVSSCGLLDPCSARGGFVIEGKRNVQGESIESFSVGPGYFQTIGLPVLFGRDFFSADVTADPRHKVGVINEALVKRFFAGRNPIGLIFQFNGDFDVEIVGVAKDSKYHALRESIFPALYVPFASTVEPKSFVLRTVDNAPNLSSAIRDVMRSVDPGLRSTDILTMGEIADATILQERLAAELATFFGLLALFLASLGLFGILSYAVKRRHKEIAIRVAIGAMRRDVTRMFMQKIGILVGIGIALGVAGALTLSRLIASLLFEVNAGDPWPIAAACALIVLASAAASYLPARRAARVDPILALRHD